MSKSNNRDENITESNMPSFLQPSAGKEEVAVDKLAGAITPMPVTTPPASAVAKTSTNYEKDRPAASSRRISRSVEEGDEGNQTRGKYSRRPRTRMRNGNSDFKGRGRNYGNKNDDLQAAGDAGFEAGVTIDKTLQGTQVHLSEMRKSTPKKLLELAEQYQLEDTGSLLRQEIIFAVLKKQALQGAEIIGDGVLEVLKEGYGFSAVH